MVPLNSFNLQLDGVILTKLRKRKDIACTEVYYKLWNGRSRLLLTVANSELPDNVEDFLNNDKLKLQIGFEI